MQKCPQELTNKVPPDRLFCTAPVGSPGSWLGDRIQRWDSFFSDPQPFFSDPHPFFLTHNPSFLTHNPSFLTHNPFFLTHNPSPFFLTQNRDPPAFFLTPSRIALFYSDPSSFNWIRKPSVLIHISREVRAEIITLDNTVKNNIAQHLLQAQ